MLTPAAECLIGLCTVLVAGDGSVAPALANTGDTTIPTGRTGWRTLMYDVDNPSGHQVGALRLMAIPPSLT